MKPEHRKLLEEINARPDSNVERLPLAIVYDDNGVPYRVRDRRIPVDDAPRESEPTEDNFIRNAVGIALGLVCGLLLLGWIWVDAFELVTR